MVNNEASSSQGNEAAAAGGQAVAPRRAEDGQVAADANHNLRSLISLRATFVRFINSTQRKVDCIWVCDF